MLFGTGMEDKPKKIFNIYGTCFPSKHYMLPAAERVADLDYPISSEICFVLQAPRQSGKTTSVKAAIDRINGEGKYYAIYCTL
jgi:predicted AAA+ superfamily ATPase